MNFSFPSWGLQIDLQKPEDLNKDQIKSAMSTNFMVIVRGTKFDKDTLLEFAAHFGTPLIKANVNPVIELIPDITNTDRAKTFSSITKMEWHSDRSFEEKIPSYSFLYAVDFGEGAGATHWANTHLAYLNLPEHLKKKCHGLKCKHALEKFSGTYQDSIYEFKSQAHQQIAFRASQSLKDVVQYSDDKPFLCINRGYTSEIVGETPEFLEELFTYTENPKIVYSHHWKTGDLIITNNPVLVHKRDESTSSQRKSLRVLLA